LGAMLGAANLSNWATKHPKGLQSENAVINNTLQNNHIQIDERKYSIDIHNK